MLFHKKQQINLCKSPFEDIIVNPNGDVFFCCQPLWKDNGILGNLNNNSFEEIWNSKKAKKIREFALKNQYPFCKHELCKLRNSGDSLIKSFLSKKTLKYKTTMNEYPRFVSLNPDYTCNINCITCRDNIYINSAEEILELNKKIDRIYLPILKNAEIVMINSCGEALASSHSKEVIKAISTTYPNIKFGLLTNGLLCNETNLKQLNIENKLLGVIVSLNAMTKETYEKFAINSNYEQVMKNIYYLKIQLINNNLKFVCISFVITAINYKEIPSFINYAETNGFFIQFLHYVDFGNKLRYSSEYLAVHKPTHPEFKEYIKIYKKYIIPYLNKTDNFDNYIN